MERKKPSKGVILWIIFLLISAISHFFYVLEAKTILTRVSTATLNIFYFACCVGLLLLKEWARKSVAIIFAFFSLLLFVGLVIFLFIFKDIQRWLLATTVTLLIINTGGFYFFTRPKVKAQFSPERSETKSKGTV